MQWLVEELGESNVQAYLAKAYPPSLNTDLRPYEAAARLQNFAAILKDPGGIQIAALSQVISEVIQADVPPTPEQSTMIAQSFADHAGDGTHYALAGQWMNALTEYVSTINTDFGGTVRIEREGKTEELTANQFVMEKYGSEVGDTTAMFVQTYLEETLGG
jgi:hypothetical protein